MINFSLKSSLTWRDIAIRTAFVVVTVAVIVWMLPRDHRISFSIERGMPWRYADLTATFSFPVYKSDSTVEREREVALSEFRPYYTLDESVGPQHLRALRLQFSHGATGLTADDYYTLVSQLNDLYAQGIVDTNEPLDDLPGDTLQLMRVVGDNATLIDASAILTPPQAYARIMSDTLLRRRLEQLPNLNLNEYVVANLHYDSLRSQIRRNELISSVPRASGTVLTGQKIISRGEVVDEAKEQMLISYLRELDQHSDTSKTATTLLGQLLYVLLVVVLMTIYLASYRSEYLERVRTAAMVYVQVVLFSVLTSILVSHNLLHVFIIPFAIVPIFVRVFLDSRTAFMTHLAVVLISASMLYRPLEFIAVETAAALTAIYTLRELSSRSQLFWTAAATTGVAMLTNFALFLMRSGDLERIDMMEYYCLLFCAVIIFCSYPLLYVIEKTFGFVSDITLIELSNTNKDLLRNMSEVAPGTFNHSIQVGNLAAEVARKIGANAQLVRTGALYHDIGKTLNPIYYTENQSGGISPHEALSYIDSAQIIIGHVTEGLKLADKNHLPSQLRDFITTHHGQGKAKYFYVKYKNEHPDEPVDDLLFTYPGPNPFTKEQAILMMADTVEAASRSLPDYTEQTIRSLVDRIVDGMVSEGYFRDCPITFRDIQYAKTVLIEKLTTIYHTRISYPEMKK